VRWAALGLGAAVLAVGLGAFAFTNRGETQNAAYTTVTEPYSSVPLPATGTADVLQPAQALAQPAPTSTEPCDNAGDEESDRTGDDDSSSRKADGSCRSDEENQNENENEGSTDDQAGDGRSDVGGDSQNDEASDEQAGENDNGD
jgi:hypothetical protein